MARVVTDSCNMESHVYTQTVHQSFSPNLPYSHTNLVSGSMFISVNCGGGGKKLNIQFNKSYFFSHEKKPVHVKENPKPLKAHFRICFQHLSEACIIPLSKVLYATQKS